MSSSEEENFNMDVSGSESDDYAPVPKKKAPPKAKAAAPKKAPAKKAAPAKKTATASKRDSAKKVNGLMLQAECCCLRFVCTVGHR